MNTTRIAAQAAAADSQPIAHALHLCSRLQGRIAALAEAIGSQDGGAEDRHLYEIDEIWGQLQYLRLGRMPR